MDTMVFLLLGISYLILLFWGLFLSKRTGLFYLSNIYLLVVVGLVYDNFVIGLGKYIGKGEFLETLSIGRHLFHALFTPTLIVFAWKICDQVGFSWAKKTVTKVITLLLTIGLILYELFIFVIGIELKPNWKNGVLTYGSVGYSGLPFMVVVVTIVLLVVGFILMKKKHFPWLFLGTLVMILGGFLSNVIKFEPMMNILELLLIISIVLTKRRFDG